MMPGYQGMTCPQASGTPNQKGHCVHSGQSLAASSRRRKKEGHLAQLSSCSQFIRQDKALGGMGKMDIKAKELQKCLG